MAGCGFVEHGYAKIARGPEKYASILHALGIPAPDLLAWGVDHRVTPVVISVLDCSKGFGHTDLVTC